MDQKLSQLNLRGTPDRANDFLYVINGGSEYRSTVNNLLGITSQPVSINDVQTLTNKTFTAPTIISPVLNGTVTGTYTLGGTPTFPATVVTLTGTQTLTGKTLTNPIINSPTITNASTTADAINGFTTANTGTIYGLAITNGSISNLSSAIADSSIVASKLSPSAITLGYTQLTSTFNTASTAPTQITGLSLTVNVPSGGRRIKVSFYTSQMYNTAAVITQVTLWDGVVNSGLQLQSALLNANGNSASTTIPIYSQVIVSPAAGSKTYNVGMNVTGGTGSIFASATAPAFLLVEAA